MGFLQTQLEDYKVNAGMLTLAGPAPLSQQRTCVSGRTCAFDQIQGVALKAQDKVMILEICVRFRGPPLVYDHEEDIIERFPSMAVSGGDGASF